MGEINQLIDFVKIAATEIYKELHAGYNETIYEEAMAFELRIFRFEIKIHGKHNQVKLQNHLQ